MDQPGVARGLWGACGIPGRAGSGSIERRSDGGDGAGRLRGGEKMGWDGMQCRGAGISGAGQAHTGRAPMHGAGLRLRLWRQRGCGSGWEGLAQRAAWLPATKRPARGWRSGRRSCRCRQKARTRLAGATRAAVSSRRCCCWPVPPAQPSMEARARRMPHTGFSRSCRTAPLRTSPSVRSNQSPARETHTGGRGELAHCEQHSV